MAEPAPASLPAHRRLAHLAHRAAKALPAAARLREGGVHAALATIAALLAYLPMRALGVREGYWATMTALVVTQTALVQTRTVARDQFVGALVGGGVASAAGLAIGTGMAAYAIAVPAAVLLAYALNVASAARISATTATIILLVPHVGIGDATMMVARVGEVTWGVLCGIGVATIGDAVRRHFGNHDDDA